MIAKIPVFRMALHDLMDHTKMIEIVKEVLMMVDPPDLPVSIFRSYTYTTILIKKNATLDRW